MHASSPTFFLGCAVSCPSRRYTKLPDVAVMKQSVGKPLLPIGQMLFIAGLGL